MAHLQGLVATTLVVYKSYCKNCSQPETEHFVEQYTIEGLPCSCEFPARLRGKILNWLSGNGRMSDVCKW